jgi:hypothetical protein
VTSDEPRFERLAGTPLERVNESDQFHDYVLGRYEPLTPAVGKLRGLNLLVESFALAGVEQEGVALLERVRTEYGPYRTVWGIKWNRDLGTLGWELYFYDFERVHADCSLARLRTLLAPALHLDAEEPWALPWHMLSIEFGPEQLRTNGSVPAHVYVDMRSYALEGTTFTFENVYTFHDPRTDIDEVLHRLRSSVHFDPGRDSLAVLLPPSLFRCGRLCVANKRTSDALYASRIPTRALREFLERQSWPEPLRRFVAHTAPEFDHLLWDVGLDFRRAEHGPVTHKTGVYGSF